MSYGSDDWEQEGWPCDICGKVLPTENGWRGHMLSKVHENKRTRCVFCPRDFLTPAVVIMHLEQGKCGNMTRADIYFAVKSWEVLSGNHNRFTANCYGEEEFEEGFQSRRMATRKSFNGTYFVCRFCYKFFDKLYQLNQHLNSAAHDTKKYQCGTCDIRFQLFSALIQHIESGRCGAMSYKTVKKYANKVVRHMRQRQSS